MKKKYIVWALLVLILGISAYLRVASIKYGLYDEQSRPDEQAYKNFVLWGMAKIFDQEMPKGVGTLAGTYMNYLGLLSAEFGLENFKKLLSDDESVRSQFFIKAVHEPQDLFLKMRVTSLIFSLGAIVVVFLLGTKLFGNLAGLLAALTCSFSPLMVTEGKSGKEDSFVLFFLLLGIYGLVIWVKSGSFWSPRMSAFSAGVAFGSKILGILLLPLYACKIASDFFRQAKTSSFGGPLKKAICSVEILITYFIVGYLFFNLNFWVSPIDLLRGYLAIFKIWGPKPEAAFNLPFFLFEVLPYGIGWVLSALAFVAVIYFLLKKNWSALSLAAICGMLLVLLNNSPLVFDRYILFLIPAATILAFGFIASVTVGKSIGIRVGIPILILVAAAWQLVPITLATNDILGKPSTRKLAGDYLRKQVSEGDSALVLRYDFWLGQGPMYGLNPVKRDWFDNPKWIERAKEYVAFDNMEFISINNLGDRNPDWVVVEYLSNGQMSLYTKQIHIAEPLLKSGYEEVFSTTPAIYFEKVKFNSWALPIAGIEKAETYGPRIKIFKKTNSQ